MSLVSAVKYQCLSKLAFLLHHTIFTDFLNQLYCLSVELLLIYSRSFINSASWPIFTYRTTLIFSWGAAATCTVAFSPYANFGRAAALLILNPVERDHGSTMTSQGAALQNQNNELVKCARTFFV